MEATRVYLFRHRLTSATSPFPPESPFIKSLRTRTAMANRKPVDDTMPQNQRFIEAARELGADEDEATFKAKLAVIARQKVNDELAPPAKPKRRPATKA